MHEENKTRWGAEYVEDTGDLRLVEEGLNQSEIALGSGASRAAVQDYLRRAEAQEITFRKAKEMSDEPGSRGCAAPSAVIRNLGAAKFT